MAELTADEIRNLPLPDLALRVLAEYANGEKANLNNVVQGIIQYGHRDEPDANQLAARVAEAWAWLEAHGMLARDYDSATNAPWQRPTALAREMLANPGVLDKVWAAERLAGDLDTVLSSAMTNFSLGDYETASFAAMKAVEVEVRRAAALPNDLLGVKLMRKAFSPDDGALRDPDAERGEQQATADLFAGAIGLYKNPASHRTVEFDDPVEAAEVVQLADLLLRIVHRAEQRIAES
ncbi:TIGR02391 family protein [Arthrobacter bambusae]|uniref:TIGR02391 family protein n=1 Tax=Arthrobacter bambusae TaxID=1338426 RepID=UPI00278B8C31|nr:TIGR02391 family protein [Arthrobacter bambusae]MDQ0212571.1 uncharacterized protein (TIGR02391 family) [Arthrobacter bambusae]MDQ0236953.1 uncharacterized protein (TIGR02391 family) [Arthrobacter bambusae]